MGAFGSMSLVVPQTTMQRAIPNAVLGRIGAVFLTGEAAATLAGAAAGPILAQAAGLTATAAVASLVTLAAAALARLSIPAQRRELLAGQGVVDAVAGLPDGEGPGKVHGPIIPEASPSAAS